MARILIIDDDPSLCSLVVEILGNLKHEVDVSHTAAEGLEKSKMQVPELFIIDINMPGMNGYELCKKLRAEPNTRKTPILMLTGVSTLPSAMQGMASGANDYLNKPFNVDDFSARVQMLLSRAY